VITIVTQPSNGSAAGSSGGTVGYTPNTDFIGVDTLRYQVCDTTSLCDTAQVTITVNDAAPTAVDDTATTDEATPVDIDLDANDTDPQSDLDISSINLLIAGSIHGTATLNSTTGVVTYTPDDGYDGTATFGYQICDDTSLCDTATVTITINPVNENPIAVDDSATTSTNTDVIIDVLANDSDPDATETTPNDLDPASVTVTATP